MNTSSFKDIVPFIALALGGPLGGAAAAFVADKLGFSNKSVVNVISALQEGELTPEQILQLKQAEVEFKNFLNRNEIDLEKIQAADTKSAREMQTVARSKTPEWLTFVVTFGFFGVLFYILVFDSKPGEVMLIMLGQLGTAWAAVVGFWFGSTAGSSRKTDLLARSPAISLSETK